MNLSQKRRYVYQHYMKQYLRCIAGIDENVGRLLAFLDRNNLTENTVVIYTSDQGHFQGEHGFYDKRFMYEESLKMPFLIRYPKEIKPRSACDDIIINADFAPLFLDYAGQPVPTDMQGVSFRKNLAGQTPGNWRTAMYYRYWLHMAHHGVPAHYGTRTKRFKLIFYYGHPLDAAGSEKEPTQPHWELFDLQKDPSEMHNVYGNPEYIEVTRDLKKQLLALKKTLKDTDQQYPQMRQITAQHW